jgi:hypothetical protein
VRLTPQDSSAEKSFLLGGYVYRVWWYNSNSYTLKGAFNLQKVQDNQLTQLQSRFNSFIETLETIEPEKVDLEEIDRLIQMIDEIEEKCIEIKEHE